MQAGTLYADELRRYRFDDNERRRDHLRRSILSLGASITRFLSRYTKWRTVLLAVGVSLLSASQTLV